MPYVKFNGPYAAFITGRDVSHAVSYDDASSDLCAGFVESAGEGDTEIDEREYHITAATIHAYNEALPKPEEPEPVQPLSRDEVAELRALIKPVSR